MKEINGKNYIKINHEGIYVAVDERQKSIVLNGKEYVLADEVWGFLLCIEAERDYFRQKYLEVCGVQDETKH